jgi:hypothetical protein
MPDFTGENLFRDSEDYFFGHDDEGEQFAKMLGLNGTYWTWLTANNKIHALDRQIDNANFSEDGIKEINDLINELAEQAANANYASRRVIITLDDNRDLQIQVAIHPHTQSKVIQFMIDHVRHCPDQTCEVRDDAKYLVSEGYLTMPKMVEATIWSADERLHITGILDQLDAALRDATN